MDNGSERIDMSTVVSTSASGPGEGYQLKEKVAELATFILEKHPRMPTLLREIHTTLGKYPEQVTLLGEEEIGVIVSGLAVQTNTMFAQAMVKGSASTTKSLVKKVAQLGADAF